MKFSAKKLIGGVLLGSLLIGGAVAPAPATALGNCKDARSLINTASYTPKETYTGGAKLGYYSLAPSILSENHPTRVTVFTGKIADFKLTAVNAPFSKNGSQYDFANSVPNLATYVNGDFIGANNMPYSAIIRDGRMIYAPAVGSIGDPAHNGSTRVFGYARQTYSEANGFSVSAPLTTSGASVQVVGVNLKTIPANAVVAFTPKAASSKIAKGKFAILVTKGKVSKTFLMGTSARPTTGIVFQATGTAVAKLKKFLNNRAANYTMPPLVKSTLVADTVAPTGFVAFGTNKIRIRAINFVGPNNYGATLYDSNFQGVQTVGAASFQTDTKGNVLAVSPSRGYKFTIAPGKYVFQVSKEQSSLVASLRVGLNVKIDERFSSAGKNTITDAAGRGSLLLVDGVNKEDCVGVSEYVRPRTVIGWNESGQFWVLTASMGMHFVDNNYRLGGATIHQTGDWLKELGATQAVSFDGGGSTEQFGTVNGVVERINLPADEWIRDIPVGLAFSARG